MKPKLKIINNFQSSFLEDDAVFPSTRFQGSKLKIVNWIWQAIKKLDFETALDAFGGTGCVGYLLKSKGKQVAYNDILKFNWYIGSALIENDETRLPKDDVDFLLQEHSHVQYPTLIYDTFKDIYFTDEENRWIDVVSTNISKMTDFHKKAIAYFAFFQACIIKRPYNLFHRKNLYIRCSDVERNFGNKVTWDTSFEVHFRKFVNEANQAVFCNGKRNTSLNRDVFDIDGSYDLVYIDTPYISQKGTGVDYLSFYHFLEGLVNYSTWKKNIDYKTKNKKLKSDKSVWTDKNNIYSAFDKLFEKFRDSIIVVSYRADGIPTIKEIIDILKKYKTNVTEIGRKSYKYVLSSNHSEEVLLIGQ